MKLFRDMFNDLDAFGRFWLVVGLTALVAAAAMSFDFGWGVSAKHAIFLAVLTIVAAFGPMAAEMLWGRGRRGPAIATALVCIPLLGIEFYSHAGYTAGLRGSNIETASVQNARYDGAQEAVKEDKTNLAMWSKRLADLEAQNGWVTVQTADALRAQLASANLAIEQEAARGGCKSKCLARTKERDDLASKIALAEEHTNLTKQIAATKRLLDKARTTAATTEHKSSAVAHQNASLAKWVALVSNGDTKASDLQVAASQESANLAMAIAGTGLPAFALFLAGLFRVRRREDDDQPSLPSSTSAIVSMPVSPSISRPRPVLTTHTVAQLRAMAA